MGGGFFRVRKLSQSAAKYTTKDLQRLASEHGIESRLYSGNDIERIYQLLSNNRVTRWPSTMCGELYDDETLWNKLIDFLEKDLRVQQQKELIQSKVEEKKLAKWNNVDAKQNGRFNNQFITSSPGEVKCFFCNESEEHVATNGPKGTKIIQYFACKKVTEITPSERYQELKRKGFCIQCLFPGARQNLGKHNDGKCLRDFICKEKLHNKFPNKKHVLVCQEHRQNNENQQLLQKHKEKYTLKHIQLPIFSKDLKLIFHTNQQQLGTNYQSSSQESAIYILQSIKVDKKVYSLFYDTGC